MKIKSLAAGLVLATSMVLVVGPIQASCCHDYTPGWHMVPKSCNYVPAVTWQQYYSGGYLQPAGGNLYIPVVSGGWWLW